MNYYSRKLSENEAKIIKADPEMRKRLILSYKLMLNFYGMKLKDENTGEIERESNYKERYASFTFHNNLRITRILQCLGELGFEHYKKPFIEFFAKEIFENDFMPECANSLLQYWIALLNDKEREEVEKKLHENVIISYFLYSLKTGLVRKLDEKA